VKGGLSLVTGDGSIVNVGAATVGSNLALTTGSGSTVDVGAASVTNNLVLTAGNGSTIDVGSPSVGGDMAITNGGPVLIQSPYVKGGLTVSVGDSTTVSFGSPTVSGDLTATTGSGSTVDFGSVTVAGNLTSTTGNGTTVDFGTATVAGDLTATTGGTTTVDFSGAHVSGNTTLVVGDTTTVSASTAAGSTSLTLSNGAALMQAVLPTGTFTSNVVFAVDSLAAGSVTTLGGPTNGDTFSVTTVAAYRFDFAIPTLNQDASLTFDIQLAALDAATRTTFLAALAAGNATVGVLGDAPGSTWQTFPVCATNESPTAGGCVSLVLLDATGTPLPPASTNAPAVVRFTGVAGHFSTYGVVLKQPVQLATSQIGGGALRLSWRGPASGVLETSTNLAPNSWLPTGTPAQQPDGSWRLEVVPTDPVRFYRFKLP
jgi:filamentous hemagglutinin